MEGQWKKIGQNEEAQEQSWGREWKEQKKNWAKKRGTRNENFSGAGQACVPDASPPSVNSSVETNSV